MPDVLDTGLDKAVSSSLKSLLLLPECKLSFFRLNLQVSIHQIPDRNTLPSASPLNSIQSGSFSLFFYSHATQSLVFILDCSGNRVGRINKLIQLKHLVQCLAKLLDVKQDQNLILPLFLTFEQKSALQPDCHMVYLEDLKRINIEHASTLCTLWVSSIC